MPAQPYRIAQVTPYPWEQHHEVNAYVERLSDELCARAPRGGGRAVGVESSDQGGPGAHPRDALGPRRRLPGKVRAKAETA